MGIALKPPAHMRARAAVLCSYRGIACMHEIHVYRGCLCCRQGVAMHTASSMSRSTPLASRNHVHVYMHAMVNLAVVSRTHVSPGSKERYWSTRSEYLKCMHWRHVQGAPLRSDNIMKCTPHVLAAGWVLAAPGRDCMVDPHVRRRQLPLWPLYCQDSMLIVREAGGSAGAPELSITGAVPCQQ